MAFGDSYGFWKARWSYRGLPRNSVYLCRSFFYKSMARMAKIHHWYHICLLMEFSTWQHLFMITTPFSNPRTSITLRWKVYLLRDVNIDPMSEMSSIAISNWESSMLKSREKANEFCSLLCTYRLLDVILNLEIVKEASSSPPVHQQMGINVSKNKVCTHFHLCQPLFTIYRKLCNHLRIGLSF